MCFAPIMLLSFGTCSRRPHSARIQPDVVPKSLLGFVNGDCSKRIFGQKLTEHTNAAAARRDLESAVQMRIGTILPMAEGDGPGRTPTWKEILGFARHAEAVGVDSIWVFDHIFSNAPGTEPQGVHEAWSLLSALAASTDRVELGQLVMCTSFRNPALLAKMAATTDAISGGRLTLGLGAGWHDQEYRAFGYPIDQRVSRFEEAIEIIVPLLRGETVTTQGRFCAVTEAVLLPQPERRIPILVAAKGPRMLQLTARHADAWNTAWFGEPDLRLHDRLAAFDAALNAEGRDRSSVRRTVGLEVSDADQRAAENRLADLLRAYTELGMDDVLIVLQPMTDASLDRLGEAIASRQSA